MRGFELFCLIGFLLLFSAIVAFHLFPVLYPNIWIHSQLNLSYSGPVFLYPFAWVCLFFSISFVFEKLIIFIFVFVVLLIYLLGFWERFCSNGMNHD